MNDKDYWDSIYEKFELNLSSDRWLKENLPSPMNGRNKSLDLGCGDGFDTKILIEAGYDVTSLDFSIKALDKAKKIKGSNTVLWNMKDRLPFKDNFFVLVVADLSLHYFSKERTIFLIKEIHSILKDGGILLARVNSIDDINYGANEGEEIEPHLFEIDGRTKRFFSKEDVEFFFNEFSDITYVKSTMNRYGKTKKLFEIKAIK